MATDQTEKRRALARQLIQTTAVFMDTLYALDTLRKRRDTGGASGASLVFADADFATQTGLTHLDAAAVNACFSAIPTILTAFSGQNFDKIFEATRG